MKAPSLFSMTLLILALGACAAPTAHRPANVLPPASTAANAPTTPQFLDPRWPISTVDYPTTSEAIYLGNLDASISEYERALRTTPSAGLRNVLAAALYHRFKVIGRVEDAERALVLLDVAVGEEPDVAAHRLLRATVLGAFHRFGEAEADLVVAARSGATPEIGLAQREIDLALGRYDRLANDFEQAGAPASDFYELANRADLQLMQGEFPSANRQFRAAQIEYRDTSPVPLAWLHVQRGIAALRFGDVEDAHRFFEAAHARMPRYYLASEHLAETETSRGNYDRARELYRSVIEQTGNPEFLAALASLEQAAGNEDAAKRRHQEAAAAYAEMHSRHPDAYAQHYAEYLLDAGQPQRALELAERNITLRQDVGSWILLARAADAHGQLVRACEAQRSAWATGRRPPELAEISDLATRCSGS